MVRGPRYKSYGSPLVLSYPTHEKTILKNTEWENNNFSLFTGWETLGTGYPVLMMIHPWVQLFHFPLLHQGAQIWFLDSPTHPKRKWQVEVQPVGTVLTIISPWVMRRRNRRRERGKGEKWQQGHRQECVNVNQQRDTWQERRAEATTERTGNKGAAGESSCCDATEFQTAELPDWAWLSSWWC